METDSMATYTEHKHRWADVVRSTCGTRNKNIGVALAATMLGTGHYLRAGGGGYKKFYPYEKGGGEVLAMLKGGTKSFGVVFMQ